MSETHLKPCNVTATSLSSVAM